MRIHRSALRGIRRHGWKVAVGVGALVVIALAVIAVKLPSLGELVASEDSRDLREGPEATPRPGPSVLILALDGVDRDLLYGMLRDGLLPHLATLLGGLDGRELPHAHLDETALAPMPTSTMPSWATIFTGAPPAEHGVAGNEYFVREQRRYIGLAPVSVVEPELVLRAYTEEYANDALGAPTLYERLRRRDPRLTAWVAMSPFYAGADRLILADRSVLADAFEAMLDADDDADDLEMFAALDQEVIENVVETLGIHAPPRVLTLYLSGADAYAHGSREGADVSRRQYLRQVVDPALGELRTALDRAGGLEDRWVVVVSDHGHTEVRFDDAHALSTDGDDDPPAWVRAAGYHPRPFAADVEDDAAFDVVLTYGGAVANVYVADRASCAPVCDWSLPPRFAEDVVPLADAFLARPELDLVLVRRDPRGPFEVYLGGGRTEPVDAHLARHPRHHYVEVGSRLRDLAVGARGHHAGDLLLLAKNGDEARPEDRYYFSGLYHSWHGSPSRVDSEIPLVVAHARKTAEEVRAHVRRVTGARVEATEIAAIVEALVYPEPSRP